MAEQRSLQDIYDELFKSKDAALVKYAKVRNTQYEMNLWRNHGLPLGDVSGSAKMHFARRFLVNGTIVSATESDIAKAFKSLDHAVKDGCKGRCNRLVAELSQAQETIGLAPIKDPKRLLDWLTFAYSVQRDDHGNKLVEKPYGFEIRIFHDQVNRQEFWKEATSLIKAGRMMSAEDIIALIIFRRKHVKPLSKPS